MKKLLLSLLFALVALTGLQAQTIWDGTADTSWYNETSTEFEISTAEQLAGLAKLVNNGNDFSGKTIMLTADIVLNDTSDWENWENSAPANTWTPIGNWPNLFSGTFDGQGHTVSGIYINSANDYQGLFSRNYGTIKNVGVTESHIQDYSGAYVGGVCGYNDGTISNCYNSGTVSGDYYVGGVCGFNSGGTFSNCYNSGNVNGTGKSATVGGVCGYNDGVTISNCYNSGNVSGTGESSRIGGVCGYNDGATISYCYNSGTVSGSKFVGGVCGHNSNSSTISNCYNTGTVSGSNQYIGGVCGLNSISSTISYCYNTGTVSGSNQYIGGVCGSNGGTISNCYNTGTVSGNTLVGGVCGLNDGATISYCYNSGTVSGSKFVGGVCGYNDGATISYCYNSGTVNIQDDSSNIGGICGWIRSYNLSSISNCYYLIGTAEGGINGSDVSGQAEVKTAEQFASGEVCWLLNSSSDANPTWFQTINTDDSPVLDNTHGTVYAIGNCPNSATYNNNGPSNIRDHSDSDNDGRCDFCGQIILSEPAQSNGIYQIGNRAELYWFAGLVNGTLGGVEQNREADAVLTEDIIINENVLDIDGNLTENSENLLVWEAVGFDYSNSFYGTFDGQGHTVSGIYINSENDYQGLFGYNKGTIKNIEFTESYIKGSKYVGGICSYNYGSISDCYNSGTISGNNIGGVCGINYGTISNCYNSGTVNGDYYVGGVCGENYGTISNCYYLEGTADGGIYGSDKSGQAEAKTAEQFASGEVCWLLNGKSDKNPIWFQTLNSDDAPVLDNTHGTVYSIGECPNSATYNNNGPSNIRDHSDSDNDGRCDFCGQIILSEPAQSNGIYQIGNRAELYWFAGLVNGSLDGVEQNTAANAVLTADIIINENVLDANGNLTENTENLLIWIPIGDNSSNPFSGTFDGQGHTVSGIYINSENDYQGLFGYNGGTIKNVGLTNSYIKGDYYVGGVCGYNEYGTISGCYNAGTVSGNDYSVGGVCGLNEYGTISDCYNSGTVNGNGGIGGVCGSNSGTISGCYNAGTVSGNDYYVGGVCGSNSYGTISNCYNAGTVSGNDYYVGGVCGAIYDGKISNCYYLQYTATGGINGSDISGQAEVKTAEQFASGEVCWLLNGSSDSNPTWFQAINTDDCPVLDNTHGTVYAIGNCPGSIIYNNDSGSSHIGEHADNDHDFRCDYCGMVMLQEPELSEGVYQISNLAELYWFAGLVNGSLDGIEQNTAANALLTADIIINENVLDANGNLTENTENLLIWIPIGDNSSNPFSGTFDGQGHTVSGIYINSENDYQGLFGYNSGIIKNIGVRESYIKGIYYVGGVCGYSNSTISNCYNSGIVSGYGCVGGVCGYNYYGTISNCYNTAHIVGIDIENADLNAYIGGVCGEDNYGTISSCYNTGTINGSGERLYIGIIANGTTSQISNCYYLEGCTTKEELEDFNIAEKIEAKTAEQFTSGEVCWLLNGKSDKNPIWFQTLNSDDAPVLDNAHGTVYSIGECPNSATYNNNGPSNIGEHADNDNDGLCDFCGNIVPMEPKLIDGVYQISNFAELYWFAGLVNGTLDGVEQNTAAYAVLTADIVINENVLDSSGNLTDNTDNLHIWQPMAADEDNAFVGTFDGQGYSISGLYAKSYEGMAALFIWNSGIIKNLGIVDSYIYSDEVAGSIAVINLLGGTISQCYNKGTVKGSYYVGGIAGVNAEGIINGCYNAGDIYGSEFTGGIVGDNSYNGRGSISNCYNIGQVNGTEGVGGIAGNNETVIISNNYYLQGTATGGFGGVDTKGQAEVKTAEQFASGEVCWLLNGSSDKNPIWFQTLGTDISPVLDNTHATVYAKGNCPNDSDNTYSNQGPSVGEHRDNNTDGLCDICGKIMTQEPAQLDGIYQISNRAELYWFAGLVNGSLGGVKQNLEANAVLTADIIINENVVAEYGSLTANAESLLVWTSIGHAAIPFGGTFDGQGHSVCGVYINSENACQGLFGYNNGTIKNVGVTESYIEGSSIVGGVCGENRGTISNCYNSGTVSGGYYVGGVCGYNNEGTISDCYNSGTVSGNGYYVGGVCGSNYEGTISDCSNSGNVSDSDRVGGVCGENYGTISNCYNSGTVNGDYYVGGVCGWNSNTISNYGTISNCYNSGNVSGTGKYSSVGSVCGYNYGSISNCYYLEGTADGGIYGSSDKSGQAEAKTAEQFASGEVCWLLNEEQSEGAWGQKLDTDPCPVLGGPAVFKDGETYYNEEGSAIIETNSEQASFVIVSENLTIKIYGSDHEATVYNLAGIIIYQGSERIIPVPNPGMYMVRIGNEVQKTIVR